MALIETFKDLKVWQNAVDTAMQIFELSRRFPTEERYALTDQIRRSSRSVAANISEAWHKRRYPASFISKLSDAEAEAAETRTWLDFSLRCGYLSSKEARSLDDAASKAIGQLVLMANQVDKWTIPSKR